MEKRLMRNMPGKMIGGVAAGLAEYLDIDATIVRLLFVVATFFHGSGLLVYIVLWIAMPASTTSLTYSGTHEPSLQNPAQPAAGREPSGNRSAAVIGWILVGLGIFFLMDEFLEPWFREFFYWFNFRRIWPVVFIIVGVLIISSATKKAARQEPGKDPLDPVYPPAPGNPPDPQPPAAPSAPRGSSGYTGPAGASPGSSAPRSSPGYTGGQGPSRTTPSGPKSDPPAGGDEPSDDQADSDKI